MAADHGAEEQQDQYPTNQLKREHCNIPNPRHAFSSCSVAWDISGGSTARKWTAT
jgi:hypothetical protein